MDRFDLTFRVESIDMAGNFSSINFADNITDAIDFAIDCSEIGCQEIVLLDSNDAEYSIH